MKPLVLQGLDTRSGKNKGHEPAQVPIERPRDRISFKESDNFLDDWTEVLLFDEKAPFQPIEEKERIPDVIQMLSATPRANSGSLPAGSG